MLGGVRAQAQLRETFAATVSRVMANRQVVIGNAAKKIADGRLIDQPTLDFALAAIDLLLDEVRLLRAVE
jgi:chromate reductase